MFINQLPGNYFCKSPLLQSHRRVDDPQGIHQGHALTRHGFRDQHDFDMQSDGQFVVFGTHVGDIGRILGSEPSYTDPNRGM